MKINYFTGFSDDTWKRIRYSRIVNLHFSTAVDWETKKSWVSEWCSLSWWNFSKSTDRLWSFFVAKWITLWRGICWQSATWRRFALSFPYCSLMSLFSLRSCYDIVIGLALCMLDLNSYWVTEWPRSGFSSQISLVHLEQTRACERSGIGAEKKSRVGKKIEWAGEERWARMSENNGSGVE